MSYLCEKRKMQPERFVFAAWVCCMLSLVTSALCTSIPTLAVTQGFLLGFSALLIEMPGLIILDSWFVERRGFAYGLLFAFADIFGPAWGYLARYTLGLHGLRFTMLIFAASAAIIPGAAIWTFKTRPCLSAIDQQLAASQVSNDSLSEDAQPNSGDGPQPGARNTFLRHPMFYIFILTTCIQSFAYYVPSIYLPTYNMQVLSGIIDCTAQNTNLLAVLDLAQIPGEFAFGWLSDKYNVHFLSVISSLVAGIATFLLWAGLFGEIQVTFGALLAFAGVFSAFGAGFLTLWGRMSMTFSEDQTVYSILSFVRGVSTLCSGPISIALLSWGTRLDKTSSDEYGHRGCESKYEVLILFIGSCMVVAAVVAGLGWVVERLTKVETAGKASFEDGSELGFAETVPVHLESEYGKLGAVWVSEKELDGASSIGSQSP